MQQEEKFENIAKLLNAKIILRKSNYDTIWNEKKMAKKNNPQKDHKKSLYFLYFVLFKCQPPLVKETIIQSFERWWTIWS